MALPRPRGSATRRRHQAAARDREELGATAPRDRWKFVAAGRMHRSNQQSPVAMHGNEGFTGSPILVFGRRPTWNKGSQSGTPVIFMKWSVELTMQSAQAFVSRSCNS